MGHQEVRKGSCATMGYLSFALLVSMAMAAIPKLPNKPETGGPPMETRRHQPEEPKNQGIPLGEKDFSQASKLPIIQPPLTTRQLMKIMEDGELKGAESKDDTQPMTRTRNGLEPIIRHWPPSSSGSGTRKQGRESAGARLLASKPRNLFPLALSCARGPVISCHVLYIMSCHMLEISFEYFI